MIQVYVGMGIVTLQQIISHVIVSAVNILGNFLHNLCYLGLLKI